MWTYVRGRARCRRRARLGANSTLNTQSFSCPNEEGSHGFHVYVVPNWDSVALSESHKRHKYSTLHIHLFSSLPLPTTYDPTHDSSH